MAIRRRWALAALALVLSANSAIAASYRTTNFIVDAPNDRLAKEFGDAAEYYRKAKAKEWLGKEMPNWQRPCPLEVRISPEGPSGATTFDFGQHPIYQFMKIQGPKERLLNSVLPHEITHTVFAYYFQQPVPRWADEGGAVLSEDDIERGRHDQMCRQMLNQGQAMQLGYLFSLKDYPANVMVLYAEGFSISRFLVDQADRETFLKFIQQGMQHGWDKAVQTHYHLQSVRQLETAWIDSLKKPRSGAVAMNNSRNEVPRGVSGEMTGRRVTRTTDPPALPDLSSGVFRGSGAVLGAPAENIGTSNSPGSRPFRLPELDNPPPPPLPTPPPIPLPQQPARLGTPSLR
jgi:hypothetical protein